MTKHLRKVLRIPYHKIYITFDESIYYGQTKLKIKRLLKSQKWLDGINKIETKHKENYTKIYWKGKYND